MYRSRAAQCRCTNGIYSRSYTKSDPDDATDAHGSVTEMLDVDAKRNQTDLTRTGSSVLSRDFSRKSIAVEVLKKVDADKMNRLTMQNLKLSLLFPQASSLIMSRAIPPYFSL